MSDDCSSVTQSPCNPLSVYAGNMSQYNNTIFYFIGNTTINVDGITMTAVKNVTLQGLNESPSIYCNGVPKFSIFVYYSNHVTISNLSFIDCSLKIHSSNNITIANSSFTAETHNKKVKLINTFDSKIASSKFTNVTLLIWYVSLQHDWCHNYLLTLTNFNFTGSEMNLRIQNGNSYHISVIFHHVNNFKAATNLSLMEGHFRIAIVHSSFYGQNTFGSFNIQMRANYILIHCNHPHVQHHLHIQHHKSLLKIEDSQFHHIRYGLSVNCSKNLVLKQKYHFKIKNCSIYDNIQGLFIVRLPEQVQIDIIDTKLSGNRENKIMNSNSTRLSNVIISNSTSTGLTLERSSVTIKNNLIFKNNTGVVGGGLAINDSSRLILTSSANLTFIDNHASYRGGGFYVEESTQSDIKFMTTNVPLTLTNNSARVGRDIYGYYKHKKHHFHLTNPNVSAIANAGHICFCDPDKHNRICSNRSNHGSDQHIYPGQELKFNVALFGFNYFRKRTPTGGIVKVYSHSKLQYQKNILNNCSLVEYKPKQIKYGYRNYLTLSFSKLLNHITSFFTVNECPIGFRLDKSHESCTCSQSVSRDNVTCDINSLNITHNGLLWIGTYHTSTPFNANETNPNACIINEDCLLYCSPNPVTFKLNQTDTQCVDNRGHRMCGSCREGYSLLMGSNKCEHCHNNYMMIAWIVLFAVMGVLLVILLIVLNLTVSVGTLNGLLFYANIVKLYKPVFSRKGALPVLSQVISWINLDFGFEICFYNGMDSYAKQWLQFVFPFYLWIIIIIIIQLCRRYGKISRLMGSHAVPVLSTLFLLSYTKLVRTIVIVLHKREVTLHCTNESVRSVSLWYEDPNVEYAKGKHAGLFGFALLVTFFFVIPFTLFLLLNPFYEKYLSNFKFLKKLWSHLKPIIDAYSGPMKDEYRFWPGLLLVARIPVLLSVTLVDSFIQSHSFLLSMLLIVLVIVLSLGYCFGGVYKKRMNNVLEVLFLFNLCIMVGLSVAFNGDSKILIWYNTCLSVFIFSFIFIVVYHLYLQLSHMKCYDALIKKKQDEDDEPLLDVTEPHKTVDQQRREIVPSSTDVGLSTSRESVVELF